MHCLLTLKTHNTDTQTHPGGPQGCVNGCVGDRLGLHDAQHLTNNLIWKTSCSYVGMALPSQWSHAKHWINGVEKIVNLMLWASESSEGLDRLYGRLTVSTENLFCRHQISSARIRQGNNEMLTIRGRKWKTLFAQLKWKERENKAPFDLGLILLGRLSWSACDLNLIQRERPCFFKKDLRVSAVRRAAGLSTFFILCVKTE